MSGNVGCRPPAFVPPFVRPDPRRLVGATHASWRACMGRTFRQRAPRESHATEGSLGVVWVGRPFRSPVRRAQDVATGGNGGCRPPAFVPVFVRPDPRRLVGATHASRRACMGRTFPSGPRASPTRPEGAWESCGSGDHSGRPYAHMDPRRLVGVTHASRRACMGRTFPQRAPRESHATGGSLGIVWVERAWGAPSPQFGHPTCLREGVIGSPRPRA